MDDPDFRVCVHERDLAQPALRIAVEYARLDPRGVQLPQDIVVQKAVFYNTLGQRVMETENDASWNVAHLSAGMHFITLFTNKGSVNLQFVKN